MITQEHLKHWIKEARYQLQGISNEVAPDKEHVSFDYIREKLETINGVIRSIEYDTKMDGTFVQDDLKAELDNIDTDEIIEYVIKNLFNEVKEAVQEQAS